MLKLATFIVDKRSLIFLIVIIGIIFSAVAVNWVNVENDLTAYLPADSSTKIGLDVMEREFITYGTASFMVGNISYEEAEKLFEEIKQVEGVQMVDFNNTTEHYNQASALFSVTFDYEQTDERCVESLNTIQEMLSDYDTFVSTTVIDTMAETIKKEVNMITAFVAVIVVGVLAFTTDTYADVAVVGLTFVVAAILNMGCNFLLGNPTRLRRFCSWPWLWTTRLSTATASRKSTRRMSGGKPSSFPCQRRSRRSGRAA